MNKFAVFLIGFLFILLLLFSFHPLMISPASTELTTQEQINETINDYATIIQIRNPDGKPGEKIYFDAGGAPIPGSDGYYGIRRIYEECEIFRLDQLLQQNPWMVVVAAIILLVITLFLNRRARIALLVLYVVFILYMTLFTRESGEPRSNLKLFWSYRQLFEFNSLSLETGNNIWLFVPFGAMLCSLKPNPKTLLVAVGFAVIIESGQYLFGLGLCELDDVLSNSIGACLGWGCFSRGQRMFRKKTANH